MAMVANTSDFSNFTVAARTLEKIMVIMWFVVTFTVFKNDELVLYPLALYFFYAFFKHRRVTLPILAKCWPLMLLPFWSALTSPFAVVPSTALRSSIQMILTIQVCILLTTWMRPREILLTVIAATGICGVLSIFYTSYHDGAMTGIFAHKNMLGAKMLLLWSASLCIAFDRWMRLWMRVVAFAMAILAFSLILSSHSATALVLAILIVVMIVGFSFFAGAGAQTPVDRIAIGLIVIGVAGMAMTFMLSANVDSPLTFLLEKLGKNRTLTGRTELWAYAEDVIRQRPLLGHGDGGFWRYEESDLVRQIFAEFHKSPKQVFSFHSAFYEVSVHFGLIGLGLMIVTLFWAFGRLLLQLVRRGGMPFVFFTSVALVELVRAFVESEMMRPFVLAHMLIWIGAIYVSKYPLRS
jgi:exopolysaccharide production protein ExoQ